LEEGEITLVQAEGSTAEVTTPTTCVKEGEDQADDVRTSPVHYAGEVQGDREATRTLSEKESLPTGRGNESTSPTARLEIPGMCVAVEGSVLSSERQCASHVGVSSLRYVSVPSHPILAPLVGHEEETAPIPPPRRKRKKKQMEKQMSLEELDVSHFSTTFGTMSKECSISYPLATVECNISAVHDSGKY